MAQGYYTLEEASKILGISTEELKQMSRAKTLRSFQDRGTLHFRVQDIQEMGRLRSTTSDPDLILGEASLPPRTSATPKSGGAPRSGHAPKSSVPKASTPKPGTAPDVFDFEFDADTGGSGLNLAPPSSGRRKSGLGKHPPKPHKDDSDSDVRLVAEGSDINLSPTGSPPKPTSDVPRRSKLQAAMPKPTHPSQPPSGGPSSSKVLPGSSGVVRSSKPGGSPPSPGRISPRPGQQPIDSGVRLVPMDSDHEMHLMGGRTDEIDLGATPPSTGADSSVRLEGPTHHLKDEDSLNQTEEINLDEELRRQEESQKKQSPTRVKPKSEVRFPTSSPFELSEMDVDLPAELKSSPKGLTESSDFDLVPNEADSSPMKDSDDFSLEIAGDDSVSFDHPVQELTGSTSGISLNNPVDAGISLEDAPGQEDSNDFDLSLDAEDSTGHSHPTEGDSTSSEFDLSLDPNSEDAASSEFDLSLEAEPGDDTSSEFDLSLDASPGEGSSSEFELSLDAGDAGSTSDSDFSLDLPAESPAESSSEFELTLDDAGALDAPQVKASAEDEENVFENDFAVPDLDEVANEGGSEDLESSDFDLALDDSDLGEGDDESGSQVIALDEDVEIDELEPATSGEMEVLDDDASDFEEMEADEEEGAPRKKGKGGRVEVREVPVMVKPAPWGVLPVAFMLPCLVVMVLVGLMGFELVQSSSGFKPQGMLTKTISGMFK